jgi:hypothetical protein
MEAMDYGNEDDGMIDDDGIGVANDDICAADNEVNDDIVTLLILPLLPLPLLPLPDDVNVDEVASV